MKLSALLAEAGFALYAIHPRHWAGVSFVGDTGWSSERLARACLVYLSEDGTSGVAVSNVDPAIHREGGALDRHLDAFVARFDPSFELARLKRRRAERFPASDFDAGDLVVAAAGRQAGARLHRHRTLPLQLMRLALRAGPSITDVGVAGWAAGVRDLAPLLQSVDAAFAAEFDARETPAYPPPEWEDPGV